MRGKGTVIYYLEGAALRSPEPGNAPPPFQALYWAIFDEFPNLPFCFQLWLKEIARLRQTCKEMNNFFSENHLQITADCPHKLEIYPRLSDDGKMDVFAY